MGAFADYMNEQAAAQPAAPVEDTSPGQFQQGLRAGLYGTGSSLAALGGNVAEAVGAEGLSKSAYEKAREMAAQAAANAPRVSSYHQVLDSPDLGTGLRNAYDYGTGLLGQSVPGVVAGVGGALVGGLPGAIAATAPMEIGDVVQRQQADPNLRQLDPVDRLVRAGMGGGLSAAGQAIVPAGVAGKLAGRAVEGAASRSVGQIVRAGGADVAAQGAAGAGGEAVKQLATNPEAALDPEAIKEAGVGGIVAGTAMGSVGIGGELAHKAAASPGNALSRVSGAIKDAVPSGVKDAAASAATVAADATGAVKDAGKKAVSDPVGTLRDLYDGAKTKAQDFVDRMARGEDVADKGAVDAAAAAGADQGAISTLLGKLDGERVQAAKAWGDELLTKAGLPPEKRAEVAQAMGNLADKGSQAVIANAKKGWDAAQTAHKAMREVASDFASRMAESKSKTLADAAGGTKRSDDYSAIHGDLMDAISPILRDSNPAIFEDNAAGAKARQEVGSTLRTVLEAYRHGGELGSDDLFKLIGTFGNRAVDILDRTAGVMGWRADARSHDLYARLNELRAQKRDDDSVLGLMQRSLADGLQDTTTMPQLRTELKALREWASAPAKDAVEQFDHQTVIEHMRRRYGDKADDILNAIESEARAKKGQHMLDKDHTVTDEGGNEVDKSWEATHGDSPRETDRREGSTNDANVIDYGPRPKAKGEVGELAEHPRLHEDTLPSEELKKGQAYQAYHRAVDENPDMSVNFVSAKDLKESHPRVQQTIKRKAVEIAAERGIDIDEAMPLAREEVFGSFVGKDGEARPKYGVMMAEQGERVPGTIDKNNVHNVMLAEEGGKAKTSHREHPGVLKVEVPTKNGDGTRTVSLDAIKITKEMQRQFGNEHTISDDTSARLRTARMFHTGLAAALTHLRGSLSEIPDHLAIATKARDKDGKPQYITYGEVKGLMTKEHISREQRLIERHQRLGEARGKIIDRWGDDESKMPMKTRERFRDMERAQKQINDIIAHERQAKRIEKERDARVADLHRAEGGEHGELGGIESMTSRVKGEEGGAEFKDGAITYTPEQPGGRVSEIHSRTVARGEKAVAERAKRDESILTSSGAIERDPFGNIHNLGRQVNKVTINSDGTPRDPARASLPGADHPAGTGTKLPQLQARFEKLAEQPGIPGKLGKAGAVIARRLDLLSKDDLRAFTALSKFTKPHEVGPVIAELWKKYGDQMREAAKGEEPKPKAEAPKAEAPKTESKWTPDEIDHAVYLENYEDVRTKEDADAFLHGAAKRFAELLKIKDLDEDDGYRLAEYKKLFENSRMHSNDLGSFYEGTSHEYSDAQVRKAIVKAVPEVAAFVAPKGEVKYSKLAAQLHDDLERPGFGATHDSPIKHEGKFDWRAHEGKGEGHAAFGAGTYLSTAEGVHASYKNAFTAKSNGPQAVMIDGQRVDPKKFNSLNKFERAVAEVLYQGERPSSDAELRRKAIAQYEESAQFDLERSVEEAQIRIDGIFDYLGEADIDPKDMQQMKAKVALLDKAMGIKINPETGEKSYDSRKIDYDALIEYGKKEKDAGLVDAAETAKDIGAGIAALEDLDMSRFQKPLSKKSPTYEVSVDIGKHELLDWDKSMAEQDKAVRAALTGDKTVKAAYAAQFGDGVANLHRGLLHATGQDIYSALKVELGSQRAASEHLQELGILGHKYAASGGRNDTHPNYVIYADHKITTNYVHFDKSAAKSGAKQTQAQRQEVRDYMHSVLGNTVRTVFKNMPHAGEFESRAATEDIVRISAHLGDPMGTAYHESIHGFFKRLMEQGNSKVAQVLERSAMSEFVQRQMREHFKSNPEVLAQLDTPEEAAAYMYQLWAMGKQGFEIAPAAKGFFRTLTDAIRKVLGVWSQGERAEAVMQYFKSGEFKANMGAPDVVAKSLIEAGHNKALDKLHELSQPVLEVAGAFALAGGHRLRATNIRALGELADKIKPAVNTQSKDTGFINESRTKRADFLHRLGTIVEQYGNKQAHLDDALKAMQSGAQATTVEGRLLQREIQGYKNKPGLLGDVLKYMQDNNVDTKSIQPRPDYFPRMYDANAITRNMEKFTAILERHDITAKEAKAIAHRIAGSNGAEFNIETEKPGMQFMKRRSLASIPDAELAPFMKTNLFEIMNSYVTQATRRAEWAKRFGDDGSGVAALLDKAKAQGATKEHLDAAHKYLKAIDGTLGDTLNPTARRIMGNALVYENIRLLPLAIFSSVVDPLGIAVRGGTAGDAWFAFKRGFKDLRHAWTGEFKEDGDSKFAEMVGAIDHAMLDGTTSGLYTQGMVGDFAKNVNDKFFKYNLMESFNRSMRIGAARAAKEFMTRHADGTASEHSKRWMRELGYEPGEFDPAKIDDRAKMAINRWVDGAVLRPDAADKPIWMSDPHYMLVSHLKQFVYSFQETIIKRVLHEYRHGNFKPAMALASYVPVMIAADAMKGMLQGGGSQPSWKQDWDASDYLASGVERAGMLGVGQFALDGPGMLMGPTAQHILQIAEAADGKGSMGHVFAKSLPVVDAFTEAGPTFVE